MNKDSNLYNEVERFLRNQNLKLLELTKIDNSLLKCKYEDLTSNEDSFNIDYLIVNKNNGKYIIDYLPF